MPRTPPASEPGQGRFRILIRGCLRPSPRTWETSPRGNLGVPPLRGKRIELECSGEADASRCWGSRAVLAKGSAGSALLSHPALDPEEGALDSGYPTPDPDRADWTGLALSWRRTSPCGSGERRWVFLCLPDCAARHLFPQRAENLNFIAYAQRNTKGKYIFKNYVWL